MVFIRSYYTGGCDANFEFIDAAHDEDGAAKSPTTCRA